MTVSQMTIHNTNVICGHESLALEVEILKTCT